MSKRATALLAEIAAVLLIPVVIIMTGPTIGTQAQQDATATSTSAVPTATIGQATATSVAATSTPVDATATAPANTPTPASTPTAAPTSTAPAAAADLT